MVISYHSSHNHDYTLMLHGAGIFTYKTGWFWHSVGQLLGFIFHHGAMMGNGHGHGLDDPLRTVRVWGGSLGICLEKHHNLPLTSPIHKEKNIRFNLGSTSFWLVDNPNFHVFLIKTPVIAHSRAPRDTRTDGCIEGYLNWTLGYQKSKKVTITNSDLKTANTPTWRSNSEWEWCILKEPRRHSGPEFVHGI